jgi:hypothetical protein
MRKNGSECKNYVKEIIPDSEQNFQGEFGEKASFLCVKTGKNDGNRYAKTNIFERWCFVQS